MLAGDDHCPVQPVKSKIEKRTREKTFIVGNFKVITEGECHSVISLTNAGA